MIRLIVSLLFLSLVSCLHTAISPVAGPGGVPVVVKIPNTRVGQKPKNSQVMSVVENITPWEANSEKKLNEKEMARYYPGASVSDSCGVAVVVLPNEFKTKKGERFVGGLPFVVAKSTLPQPMVERAAARVAADTFRKASRTSQLVRFTDLAQQPRKAKP